MFFSTATMSTTFSASQGKLNKNARDTMKHTIVDSSPTSNRKLKPNIQKSRLLSSVGKNCNTIIEVLPCKEDIIFLVDLETPNGDAAYTKQ